MRRDLRLADRVFAWRCRRAERLLETQRRRTLEAQLRTYATARDRAELYALLNRCDDDQTAEVREILDQQSVCAEPGSRPVAGFAVSTRTRPGW